MYNAIFMVNLCSCLKLIAGIGPLGNCLLKLLFDSSHLMLLQRETHVVAQTYSFLFLYSKSLKDSQDV